MKKRRKASNFFVLISVNKILPTEFVQNRESEDININNKNTFVLHAVELSFTLSQMFPVMCNVAQANGANRNVCVNLINSCSVYYLLQTSRILHRMLAVS